MVGHIAKAIMLEPAMHQLEWLARDRLHNFETQLDAISRSEFSLPGTRKALECARLEVARLRTELDEVVQLADLDLIVSQAITINQKLFAFTNYLGILLRSTNLRNSFEAYYALNEFTQAFNIPNERLIISSEWDSAPFYIPTPPAALERFVFIGFPAFASRNALVLPLAAHEIGHAIWRLRELDAGLNKKADEQLRRLIDQDVPDFRRVFGIDGDLFYEEERDRLIGNCLKIISSQSQEVFCDIFGSTLFGLSYLYAFDFFLSPGFGSREPDYPSLVDRVRYIKMAASQIAV
jgi:hypothetical protein